MNSVIEIVDGPLPRTPPPAFVDGAGAAVCFEGVVRPDEAGRAIVAIDYEVYEPMAERTLRGLADELARRFDLAAIHVEHSRGRVPAGECSFRLRVASRHRQESLAAVGEFIDRLKQDVPIWKSPVFAEAGEGTGLSVPSPLSAPHEALAALLALLQPVATETVELAQAAGRVLAEPLLADRDSPARDVSAMDGFAVRLADLANGGEKTRPLEVCGEAMIGQPVPPLPAARAMRIVTGAAVPAGADAVVPREETVEQPGGVSLAAGVTVAAGQYIRRQGENIRAGQTVLAAGSELTAAAVSAAAAFGVARAAVHRQVRVGVIVTGDELMHCDAQPQLQLQSQPPTSNRAPTDSIGLPFRETVADALHRDSNGPALVAMLAGAPWIDLRPVRHAADDRAAIATALSAALAQCDAVLLTGGVSMGGHDHVPAAVAAAGGRIVFHRLAMRPGKPILGAVGPGGQAILGLPGNPVSVLVTARRFGGPVLGKLAGRADPDPPAAAVAVANPDERVSPLTCFRLVRLIGPGIAELVPDHGSGDVAAAARGNGFVQVEPNRSAGGSWPFYPWRL